MIELKVFIVKLFPVNRNATRCLWLMSNPTNYISKSYSIEKWYLVYWWTSIRVKLSPDVQPMQSFLKLRTVLGTMSPNKPMAKVFVIFTLSELVNLLRLPTSSPFIWKLSSAVSVTRAFSDKTQQNKHRNNIWVNYTLLLEPGNLYQLRIIKPLSP